MSLNNYRLCTVYCLYFVSICKQGAPALAYRAKQCRFGRAQQKSVGGPGVCRYPDHRLLLRFGYEAIEQARGGPRFGKALRRGGRGGSIATEDTRRHREERRMIGA